MRRRGRCNRQVGRVTEGHLETFGVDAYVHYIDCGDSFMDVCMLSIFVTLCTVFMCSITFVTAYV